MKISTKLSLIGFFSVFLSIGVSILIASYLINHQNNRQNKERLRDAYHSIEAMAIDALKELDVSYQISVQEGSWGYFGALVDSPQSPSSLLKLDSTLLRLLIKIGEMNQTDFTFYSTFGHTTGKMILHYCLKHPGRLIVAEGMLVPSKFKTELVELKEPIDLCPLPDEVAMGYSLQGFDQQAYIIYKTPYIYKGWDRASGLKAGMKTGFFIFKKKLPIELKAQSISLGVHINFYDTKAGDARNPRSEPGDVKLM